MIIPFIPLVMARGTPDGVHEFQSLYIYMVLLFIFNNEGQNVQAKLLRFRKK